MNRGVDGRKVLQDAFIGGSVYDGVHLMVSVGGAPMLADREHLGQSRLGSHLFEDPLAHHAGQGAAA